MATPIHFLINKIIFKIKTELASEWKRMSRNARPTTWFYNLKWKGKKMERWKNCRVSEKTCGWIKLQNDLRLRNFDCWWSMHRITFNLFIVTNHYHYHSYYICNLSTPNLTLIKILIPFFHIALWFHYLHVLNASIIFHMVFIVISLIFSFSYKY